MTRSLRCCAVCRRHVRSDVCPFCGAIAAVPNESRSEVAAFTGLAVPRTTRRSLFAMAAAGMAGAAVLGGCGGSQNVAIDGAPGVDAGDPYGGVPIYGGPGPAEGPVADGGASRDAATSCSPTAPAPTFAAHTSPPPAPWGQGLCTASDVAAFFDACVGRGRSLAACLQWSSANRTCAGCLVSPAAAAPRSVVVTTGAPPTSDADPLGLAPHFVANVVATCVNHFEPACGDAFVTEQACARAACDSNGRCAGATSAERIACEAAAVSGPSAVCSTWRVGSGDGGSCSQTVIASSGYCMPTYDESMRSPDALRDFVLRIGGYVCGRGE